MKSCGSWRTSCQDCSAWLGLRMRGKPKAPPVWQLPFCWQQSPSAWRMGTRPAWRKSGKNMSRGTSAITGKGLNQSREDDNTLHLLPSQCLLAFLSLLLNFQAEAFHHEEKMKRFLVDPCDLTQRMNTVSVFPLLPMQLTANFFFACRAKGWGKSLLGRMALDPGVTMRKTLLIQLRSCSCGFFFPCVFFSAPRHPRKLWVRVILPSGIWCKNVKNKQWKKTESQDLSSTQTPHPQIWWNLNGRCTPSCLWVFFHLFALTPHPVTAVHGALQKPCISNFGPAGDEAGAVAGTWVESQCGISP